VALGYTTIADLRPAEARINHACQGPMRGINMTTPRNTKQALLLAALLFPSIAFAQPETISVLTPLKGEKAYQIAGQVFGELWEKATGQRPRVVTYVNPYLKNLPAGDIVLIGSDAVQPIVHDLIQQGVLDTLAIEYGGDSYRILSLNHGGHRFLILAGGCGRSTIYAVYDFFRRRAGAEYFWDGDVVPHRSTIDFSAVDISEKPHFQYRGLRYFAHRGLHRFQAEHWDLEDWEREIDWLLKERFNLFMLRIGTDDLFQRAFPAEVPYPPIDGPDPDGVDRSLNDRTSFWPLKYRGELRKKVLQYAFDRGLLEPTDTGTITHWYSYTPTSFYRSHPDFPVITDQTQGYSLPTAAIWDIEYEGTWDSYWHLTETDLREFGSPRIFHTIGMAERKFGKTDRDNLQRKLYVYRKIQQKLREHYPDAPLLIASWDFLGWKDGDVKSLLSEFDPRKTIILDYTADNASKMSFEDYGFYRNFPWIFGIFGSLARNSDIHEDYGVLAERLREAAKDDKCIGMTMWPEISHSDTFLLQYLADNSWNPVAPDLPSAADRYCRARYPEELASRMKQLWPAFLTTSQSVQWKASGAGVISFNEPQFRVLQGSTFIDLREQRLKLLEEEYKRVRPNLNPAPDVLAGLASLSSSWYENDLWRRDAIDMARTVASRALFATMAAASLEMNSWSKGKGDPKRIRALGQLSRDLMDSLREILGSSDDFSMYASMKLLERAKELNGVVPTVNPHTEQTLKSNSENDYCRSHHYELVQHVYRAELEAYWGWVEKTLDSGKRETWRRPGEFDAMEKSIQDKFYSTPLAEMAPKEPRNVAQLTASLHRLEGLVKDLAGLTK
jgi:hypothetical protein